MASSTAAKTPAKTPAPAKPVNQPAWSFTSVTLVMLLGITLFTVLAGFSDEMGKTMVVLMWGFIIGWGLLHTTDLQNMVKAI